MGSNVGTCVGERRADAEQYSSLQWNACFAR
jgi:hypothetical protein